MKNSKILCFLKNLWKHKYGLCLLALIIVFMLGILVEKMFPQISLRIEFTVLALIGICTILLFIIYTFPKEIK